MDVASLRSPHVMEIVLVAPPPSLAVALMTERPAVSDHTWTLVFPRTLGSSAAPESMDHETDLLSALDGLQVA